MTGQGRRFRRSWALTLCTLIWSLAAQPGNIPIAAADELPIETISLPSGFKIEVFSDAVPNARQIALSPSGTMFVGTRVRERRVYALVDKDRNWKADKVFEAATDLDLPSGVAFRDGALFVAAGSRLLKFDDIENDLANPPEPTVLVDDLPSERHHGWRHIKFGPDGRLYMPIGIPCNVCEREVPFGHILTMDADGGNRRSHAKGIRSVQSLAWHPATKELWFADIGRDGMGDDVPREEINRVTTPGQHFGSPFCHAGNLPDPQLGSKAPCSRFTPPVATLQAHSTPLGITFYAGSQFPAAYRNRLFIAEHGSWDRSEPVGYRISTITFDTDGRPAAYDVFAQGWLGSGGNHWGRPTDLVVAPDGSLLVSDDFAGAIYRISYAPD